MYKNDDDLIDNEIKIRLIVDTGAKALPVGSDPAPQAEGGDRQLQRQGQHGLDLEQEIYSLKLDYIHFSR